jgi:HlyD family secretion protein
MSWKYQIMNSNAQLPNYRDSKKPSVNTKESSSGSVKTEKSSPSTYDRVVTSSLSGDNRSVPLSSSLTVPAKTDSIDTESNSWSSSVQTFLAQPPANLTSRLIAGGVAFSLAFVVWAWFGSIEEVSKAQGKLVPQGETYKVQPIELGKVSKVFVKEGQQVKAGDVLVALDLTLAQKEVERLEQTLVSSQKELQQKRALGEKVVLEAKSMAAATSAESLAQSSAVALTQEKVATLHRLLNQQKAEADAYRQRKERMQPLSVSAKERLNQLQAERKAHQERLQRLVPLAEQGAVSQEYVFQAEQALRETEQRITQSQLQEMTNASEQIFEANQALRELEARITQNQGELASNLKEVEQLRAVLVQKQAEEQRIKLEAEEKIEQLELEITQLKGKIAETTNLLLAAKTKLAQRTLKAPIDGIITSLELQNTGEVIETGKTVIEIAPYQAPLVLSATLPNREAGFVTKGMPVKIKLDAYPYQDYGVISGTVTSVSSDAKTDQQLGEVYKVKIALDKNYVVHEGEQIKFKPGQTGTADIVIRRRHIVEVLLEPIRQIKEDGINL